MTTRDPVCIPCVLGGAAVVVLATAAFWRLVKTIRR